MAARNAQNTIGAAIQSILSQTHKNLELIVVDDGSSDDTRRIVQEVQDSRVKCIGSDRQIGRGDARNRALELAGASLIAIADADDISRAHRLEKLISACDGQGGGIVGGQVADFGDWGGPVQRLQYPTDPASIQERFSRGQNAVAHQACIIERRLFERYGNYDSRCVRCQDLEFFLRIYDKVPVTNLDEVLVDYRSDANPSFAYWRENARYRRYATAVADCKTRGIASPAPGDFESQAERWFFSSIDTMAFVRDRWRRSTSEVIQLR